MSNQEDVMIYDLYVMNNSGLPVFAGCTVSDFCMSHAEQHPLHTGFIAALQSFGREVFSGDIQNLNFPNVKLNLKTSGEYTVVFVNPQSVDNDIINTKLEQVSDLFTKKYEKNIKSYAITEKQYTDFVNDVINLGLIPKDRIQSTRAYFVDDTGEQQEQSSTIFTKFKDKFRSLIKK
ncbi:MAG: hypothetical protein OEY49_07095 [Candidatus Heimdallarchaeota archaeon]|nr:hypothetical protein [Candidatus Heimdallarchaeota archaeon]